MIRYEILSSITTTASTPPYEMQTPYRHLGLLLILTLGTVLSCYSHTGQSYDSAPDQWYEYAIQACERGDQPAYEALLARSERDEEPRHCPRRPGDNDTMEQTAD